MATQYDLKKSVRPKGKEDTTVLYPKIVTYGTKTTKDIMRHAQRHSGMNAATVQGVIIYLEEVLAEYLAAGYNVKLGKIGTFSASLTSRKVEKKEEIRAASIHFDDVHFKADKELKSAIRQQMKLERVDPYRAFKTSSDAYTADERFSMLNEYLDKHGYITRTEYTQLTGLLKTKAANELRNWYLERKIGKSGRAPHIVYKKKELHDGTSPQPSDNQ